MAKLSDYSHAQLVTMLATGEKESELAARYDLTYEEVHGFLASSVAIGPSPENMTLHILPAPPQPGGSGPSAPSNAPTKIVPPPPGRR